MDPFLQIKPGVVFFSPLGLVVAKVRRPGVCSVTT